MRLGDVGVLRGGEGGVVVALEGEGVRVDKGGLARLDDQPGATCSRLTIGAARAKMAASGPSVDARDWPQLSTFVQTCLHPSPQWERETNLKYINVYQGSYRDKDSSADVILCKIERSY